MLSGTIGHLSCWERHENYGSWWAWVSWTQQTSDRTVQKIIYVSTESLIPLEDPETYRQVLRKIVDNCGRIRPYS
jgi:hypothetical protein